MKSETKFAKNKKANIGINHYWYKIGIIVHVFKLSKLQYDKESSGI